jgi:16S rRNA (cytosine967-C5)-methyltransferase
LDRIMERMFGREEGLGGVDRAFITELVYGTLRWMGRIDWVIARISRVKLERLERFVLNLLRLGTYQLLFMDRVPASAAVNESVRIVKASRRGDAAGFINAVLRRISDQSMDLEVPAGEDPSSISICHSHPLWLVERWAQKLGMEETIALCMANNRTPPLSLRTNSLRTSREELLAEVKREVPRAVPSPFSPEGILIDPPVPLSRLPRFHEGWFQVQDEASQLVGHIMDPRPGERILDACAAPGGKTTHLAQLMNNGGSIYAVDISPGRLSLLRENCRRLGVNIVTVMKRDLTKPAALASEGAFDRILLDAPCSGLGTLWRNPDIKWKRRQGDIATFSGIQRAMLDHLASGLKKGGILVYGTCTLTAEENEGVVEDFIGDNRAFEREDLGLILPQTMKSLVGADGFFRSFTHRHGMDGFFAARLKRISD